MATATVGDTIRVRDAWTWGGGKVHRFEYLATVTEADARSLRYVAIAGTQVDDNPPPNAGTFTGATMLQTAYADRVAAGRIEPVVD